MKARRRFLLLLGGTLVLVLSISIYEAIRLASGVQVYEAFASSYYLRVWMDPFFERFTGMVAIAGIITFSITLSEFDFEGKGRLLPEIRGVMIVVVGLGLVHGLWFGVFGPLVEARLARIEYQSVVALHARAVADELETEGHYDRAASTLRLYASIVEGDEDVQSRIERLTTLAAERRRSQSAERQDQAPREGIGDRAFDADGLSAPELFDRARASLAQREFYTAHYYADLAVRLSEEGGLYREDALELRASALNAIEDGIRGIEDRTEQAIFMEKREAYRNLQEGKEDHLALIRAYYQFQTLEERLPFDPDIRRFSAETRAQLEDATFFIDDAIAAQSLPGVRDILFVNRRQESNYNVVRAGQFVSAPTGDYFFDLDIVTFQTTERGAALVDHMHVPYALRVGNELLLRSIERQGVADRMDASITEPRYVVGGSDPSLPRSTIALGPSIDDVLLVAGGQSSVERLSILQLLDAYEVFQDLGHSAQAPLTELLDRVVRIVGYFVAVIFAIALGWQYRSLYVGRPPIITLLFVPALPFFLWWFFDLMRVAVDSALIALVPASEGPGVIWISIGVMIAALFAALSALARQMIHT